jgi:endothelin-converting enzyme
VGNVSSTNMTQRLIFPGGKLRPNGRKTLDENIADAGGLRSAFAAWQSHKKQGTSKNQVIRGLEEFSKEQMFFISYANSFCPKLRPHALLLQVDGDEHAPGHLRILGPLANSRAFKETSQCKVKEPVCELW